MKTTVEIPDALHRRAKFYAIQQGTTLKKLIISSLQSSLQSANTPLPAASHSAVDEEGWPVLKRTSRKKVPDSVVRALREQEGV